MIDIPSFISENQRMIRIVLVILVITGIIYYSKSFFVEKMENIIAPKPVGKTTTEPKEEVYTLSPANQNTTGVKVNFVNSEKEITPEDLLPMSQSAGDFDKQFPEGQNGLDSNNFLVAGFNIGINSVASSLRNANLSLRSDPPIPRMETGPWQQSTILPDNNRKSLE